MSLVNFLTRQPVDMPSVEQRLSDALKAIKQRDKLIKQMEEHLGCPTCYAPAELIRDEQGEPVKLFCSTCIWEKEVNLNELT